MNWRAMQRLLNRVRGRRARVGGRDVATSSRAEGAAASATQAGALPRALPLESSLDSGEDDGVQMEHDMEEIDRLVELMFGALLRRKPDQDTLLAYREGFANGTTLHDLIDDIIGSDEYRSAKQRVRQRRMASAHASGATPEHEVGDDLPTMVRRLTARLVEKGWKPQISATSKGEGSGGEEDGRRMRSLRVTLSVLDRL